MSSMRELLKRVLMARTIGYPLPPSIVKEIEAELEKPEPEPVAWMWIGQESGDVHFSNSGDTDHNWIPLYTSPPAQQKPLSDDDILGIFAGWEVLPIDTDKELIEMVKAVEAHHGIK